MKRSPLPPVLFEDDAVIAYDKPSGLLIAPDRWDKERENLMDLVHAHASPAWFNVHRLDKDTSGVVLCAKTKPALDALCAAFEARGVTKTYVALTRGAPPQERGIVDRPIAPDTARPGRMVAARQGGKPAETAYEVIERWRGHAYLRLQPHTGRTHQLRVHLACLGCPILADEFYGGGRTLYLSDIKRRYKEGRGEERPLVRRLALHAHELTFAHPASGQSVTITAPLPHEFEVAIRMLRKFSR